MCTDRRSFASYEAYDGGVVRIAQRDSLVLYVRWEEGEAHKCPTCSGTEEEHNFSRNAGLKRLQFPGK